MDRRSPPQKRTDDHAFPVRVKVLVPERGFENLLPDMHQWLDAEVGRGSYLRRPMEVEAAGTQSEPDVADLSQASPPHILSASVLDEAMQRLMTLPNRTSFLDYTPAEGHAGHRAMGVDWLKRGGVDVSEQQVVVTSGAVAEGAARSANARRHSDRTAVTPTQRHTKKARQTGAPLLFQVAIGSASARDASPRDAAPVLLPPAWAAVAEAPAGIRSSRC